MSEQPYNPEDFPQVTDEAGSTPRWVPILGVLLLICMLTWLALSVSKRPRTQAEVAPASTSELATLQRGNEIHGN